MALVSPFDKMKTKSEETAAVQNQTPGDKPVCNVCGGPTTRCTAIEGQEVYWCSRCNDGVPVLREAAK